MSLYYRILSSTTMTPHLVRYAGLPLALVLASWSLADTPDKETPLTAVQARQKVGSAVLVELTVKAAKNRLEKRGEVYLDSEEDFHDEKNLAIVVTRDGATSFRDRNIDDPAEHFRGKTIRVRGTVILKEERPRIEVDDAKQIELVPAKP